MNDLQTNSLLVALKRYINASSPRGGEVHVHGNHLEIIVYLDPEGVNRLTENWPIPTLDQESWLMRSIGAMFGEVHQKLFAQTYQRLSSPMLPMVDASLLEPLDTLEFVDEPVDDLFVVEELFFSPTHAEGVEKMGQTQSQPIDKALANTFALMLQEDTEDNDSNKPDIYQRATSLLDGNEIQRRMMTTQAAPTVSLDPKERMSELQNQLERRGARVQIGAAGGLTAVIHSGPISHEEKYSAQDIARVPIPELVSRFLEKAGKLRKTS